MNKLTYCLLSFFILLPAALAQVSFVKTEGPYGGGGQLVIDGNDNLYCSTSGGLYISTNNGDNWECIKEDFYDVPITVNKEGVIVAISGETIFLSKDKGKSWEEKEQSIPEAWDLALDSKNNIYMRTYEGLYVSNNEGSTFAKISAVDKSVNKIIIDSKDIVYVATAGGVFCSSDGGKNFKYLGLDGEDINSIAVNQSGDIFAGTDNGLFCYSANDNKWSEIKDDEEHGFGHVGISIDPIGRIYATDWDTEEDVTKISDDRGRTWSLFNQSVSGCMFNSRGQIFWSSSSIVLRYDKSGEDQTICDNGITSKDIQDIKIYPFGSWYVNSPYPEIDLLKSLDKGNNWIRLPLGREGECLNFDKLHLNSKAHIYLFNQDVEYEEEGDATTYLEYTICASMDNGKTWQTKYKDYENYGNHKFSMVIDNNDNVLLIDYFENKIYRLGNYGNKLTYFCNFPTELKGNIDIEIEENFYVEILFNKKNEIYLVLNDALYYSSDQGKKWSNLNLIPVIHDVEIMQNGDIFALITNSEEKSSIYLSKDTGKNWENFLELPEKMGYVSCFAFDDEGYLLCGTYGRGLWKSEKPVLK